MYTAWAVEVRNEGPTSLSEDVVYVAATSPAGAKKRAKEVVAQYTVLRGHRWIVMDRVYKADWERLTLNERSRVEKKNKPLIAKANKRFFAAPPVRLAKISDGRRGTGHIHPPGPRKCPKCGV